MTEEDDLGNHPALWFQEDWVHIGSRDGFCGKCLHCLGNPDFTAVRSDVRVETHILGLERCDRDSPVYKGPAECGYNRAFTGMRSCTKDDY